MKVSTNLIFLVALALLCGPSLSYAGLEEEKERLLSDEPIPSPGVRGSSLKRLFRYTRPMLKDSDFNPRAGESVTPRVDVDASSSKQKWEGPLKVILNPEEKTWLDPADAAVKMLDPRFHSVDTELVNLPDWRNQVEEQLRKHGHERHVIALHWYNPLTRSVPVAIRYHPAAGTAPPLLPGEELFAVSHVEWGLHDTPSLYVKGLEKVRNAHGLDAVMNSRPPVSGELGPGVVFSLKELVAGKFRF
ncbi:uncharacterized protein UTRI_06248 [Ustilago trichophora]|uniref:Effector family protein Eff1 n=1 Tax=Ustilago trichophora TaxID=86804 RepID=A0A5C3EJ90_9BASI|nr:uncharacterized protein UTRI_06248 [Ustilago trichophora]